MGGKDSKPAFLSYEDAVKRVTDGELRRLKDAFKRSSTLNGYMTKPVFIREVLGDGVPARLAEQMYLAFGGTTKGLSFKDLTCGLVLLTRGRQEEKMKFVFGLYANEALTHVEKEEMDRLVLATEGQVPPALSELFKDTDRVTFECFKDWLVGHADVTSVTRWMIQETTTVTLSNDLETPTFYQTLAGVTHLEETDIIELEKRYWMLKAQSKTGLFDQDTFRPIMCPPVPEALCQGLFYAFDENRDNHIDFKEMACGISACCRGPMTERQKFCFKVFDKDHDGLLNREELEAMVTAMLVVRQENTAPEVLASQKLDDVNPTTFAQAILDSHDSDNDGCLTQEDYLVWTVNHLLPNVFLDLLFQVCHVVLGLKPYSIEDEGKVISGWLEREERRGVQASQVWYLISMTWWKQWLDYVNYKPVYASIADDTNSLRRGTSTTGSRAGSICRNLARKASLSLEETGSVVGTSYTVLSPNVTDVTNSPVKFAGLPQANHVVSQSPHGSPLRTSGGETTLSPNNNSRTTTPSPSPSPKLGKRAIAPQVMQAQRPGAIDNNSLIVGNTQKVMTLTNEGGRLKRDKMLARGRDFELVPESVWKCLSSWYGGSPALPRTVISPLHGDSAPELELYPISVKLYRHQNPQQRPQQVTSFTGMIGGMGGMAVSTAGLTNSSSAAATPRRYLAYTAAFSRKHTLRQVYEFLTVRLRINREDMRIWKLKDDSNMIPLEEEESTMEDIGVEENQQMLIEVRNKDLTWPEELSQLAKNKSLIDKKQQVPTERGATGLNNLGNTCFMNSALQCVSNTRILTLYLNGGMHLYELNRTNPLGMKGHIAQRYGELVKDLWSGTAKSIAPLKLRWTIGKYAPRFNGFQQHDSQELLAFLLDGLHEDLNRVHDKPYVELKDSDGRPDEVVAKEAWENHLLRNRSVIVDLFHGQLKSCVRCLECGHTSVRFDPFTYLSLPLPMDSCIHLEIIVMRLDGSVPVKYGLRLNMDEKYRTLKKQLSELSGIPAMQILLVEIFGALVKSLPQDHQKIRNLVGGALYGYELPPMNIIPPMTVEDERQDEGGQGAMGLNQIQRMHNKCQNGGVRAITQQPMSANCNQPAQEDPPGDGEKLSADQNGGTSTPPVFNGTYNGVNNGSSNGSNDGSGDGSHNGTTNGNMTNSPATNHNRNVSNASTATSTASTIPPVPDYLSGCVVAVHRKMIRMDVYFLSSQKTRPSLFGTPLILSCEDRTTNQDVYQMVWTQVSRLVSPLPPSESGTPNHAQDCDDSLAYEFPFTLKAVQKDGFTCAWCPWYRFCRGCKIDCNTNKFRYCTSFIAVDWEPTALHLRYQTSQERVYAEHPSVEESRRLQTEPIDLDTCLKAFTKEEELGEDELYYCSKCKQHRLAAKKLDIWRLPPVLIIHLKRFQFMNGRWVKSHKIVKFPFRDFDPTNYLVPRKGSKDDITTVPTVNGGFECSLPIANGQAVMVKGTMSDVNRNDCKPFTSRGMRPNGLDNAHEVTEDAVFSEEELEEIISRRRPHSLSVEYHEDYTDVRYSLYSLSCHTGILGGGHYISQAKNPNSKWYIYNDSSCKELNEEQVDTDTAYMLFYERQGLDYNKFMPDVTGREPDTSDIEDEFESDFKRMCVIS